jgi:hypothetical protein
LEFSPCRFTSGSWAESILTVEQWKATTAEVIDAVLAWGWERELAAAQLN